MAKETKSVILASLPSIGAAMQDFFDEGYRLVEGYPIQQGWQYELRVEKDIVEEVVATKKPGRPASK